MSSVRTGRRSSSRVRSRQSDNQWTGQSRPNKADLNHNWTLEIGPRYSTCRNKSCPFDHQIVSGDARILREDAKSGFDPGENTRQFYHIPCFFQAWSTMRASAPPTSTQLFTINSDVPKSDIDELKRQIVDFNNSHIWGKSARATGVLKGTNKGSNKGSKSSVTVKSNAKSLYSKTRKSTRNSVKSVKSINSSKMKSNKTTRGRTSSPSRRTSSIRQPSKGIDERKVTIPNSRAALVQQLFNESGQSSSDSIILQKTTDSNGREMLWRPAIFAPSKTGHGTKFWQGAVDSSRRVIVRYGAVGGSAKQEAVGKYASDIDARRELKRREDIKIKKQYVRM
jgi:hypothetical protein